MTSGFSTNRVSASVSGTISGSSWRTVRAQNATSRGTNGTTGRRAAAVHCPSAVSTLIWAFGVPQMLAAIITASASVP